MAFARQDSGVAFVIREPQMRRGPGSSTDLAVIGEDRQQDLAGLVAAGEVSAHPPDVPGPVRRDRGHRVAEDERDRLIAIALGLHLPAIP